MLFTLKKYIGGLMLPLPALLILIGIGLLLVWFSRWQKTGKGIISASWLILLLLSLQPVADKMLKPIEDSYPTWRGAETVKYIVVLGGGYTWNDAWAPSSNLINNSLPRLNEGIRLLHQNPGAKLIFTGAAAKTNPVSRSRSQSGGEPGHTAQRYHHPGFTERYRRGSCRRQTGYWRCAFFTGDVRITYAKGNGFLP